MAARMWMVRAGEDARFYEEFKNKNIVSIGWDEVGDLSSAQTLANIKQKVGRHTRQRRTAGKPSVRVR